MDLGLIISFYARTNYRNKEGKYPIMLRISLNKEWLSIGSTGLTTANPFHLRNNRIIGKRCIEKEQINAALERITMKLNVIFRTLESSGNPYSLKDVKKKFMNKTSDSTRLFSEFSTTFIEKCHERVEIGEITPFTQRKYLYVKDTFLRFLIQQYQLSDIALANITPKMVDEFYLYLMSFTGCCRNTANARMKVLKTLLTTAKKQGFITSDPFIDFRSTPAVSLRGFLTEDELNQIANTYISEHRLGIIRDIFLFACFTGLSFADVADLRPEHLVKLDDQDWIMISRHKTNIPSNIPLLDIPKAILRKYDIQGEGSYPLLPVISNQKTNQLLKILAIRCGINKNLTFHVARHTFATLTLSKGVSMESVSRMLGHTSLKTTQIYAKITNRKVREDMALFASKIEGNFSRI